MQTELDLVTALRAGDQAAYKKLHDQLFCHIFYFASSLIGSRFDANVVATEVFERMWILRRNFDTYQNLKAFLYLATRNACLNYLEEQTRLANQNKKLLQQLADKEEDLYRPDLLRVEMVRSEMLEYFYMEIKRLPRLTRKIIQMRLQRMATTTIASKLRLSEGTIRNKFSAGIKQLREKQGLRKRWLEFRIMMRE